ncbi:DUF6924 domain-containing protein [Amycolatopsis australiensis]|uniref:DUF6924 domain-containing protein n=1 Tax=Amycolatopsis australiensis TaxID=546364 RepID=A0A1K1SLU4_9PSEU|nr:hypothetical protein [Amycolatopsis australiensis]SFW85305.1 hypothetical protein SAMN04489730_6098 [Amycolatopsis australiensis]
MTTLPSSPVLVRTWFGDDDAWAALAEEARTPSEDGFLAHLSLVDDRAFEGMDADALRAKQTAGPIVSFLADETTLTSAEHPVLAVWVLPRADGGFRPFRVLPAHLWSVENNINLANMDWADFTTSTGEDGVFRGF